MCYTLFGSPWFYKSLSLCSSCAHKCLSCNMFYDLICTVMAITDTSGNTRKSIMMNPITENDFHLHGSAGFPQATGSIQNWR